MLNAADELGWGGGALLLGALTAAGFLTSWLATDLVRMSRTAYVGVLAAVTAVATGAVVAVTGVGAGELVGHGWRAGVAAGVATGAAVAIGIRKMPATLPRSGHDLHRAEAWEGVVYGVSEGVLLSALPALVAWQAAADAGWGTVPAWAVALVASAAMIAVHHFGYWDFRGRQVIPVVAGCLVLTVGYLATGSLVAPALGHVVMHVAGITKGVELPPHEHLPAAHRRDGLLPIRTGR